MDLSVRIMKKENTIDSVLRFQTDETAQYRRKILFKVYPFLDEEKCSNLQWNDKKQYLTAELSAYYGKIKPDLQNKLEKSQKVWSENKKAVNDVYSKVFGINCFDILNNMVAEISLNPICPRTLKSSSFSFFWGGDDDNFFKTALHEMIHFVWFCVWQRHFKDDEKEYERPHIKWILSEMVVDTFVRNSQIGELFPERYKQQTAYKYFYDIKVNGALILDTLSAIKIKSKSVEEFMENAYKYCLNNESDIRRQML